jgi:SH3-like domain-containing protein
VRYPVAWRFVRRGLPVEVIAEYELWRKIRDRDGAEGWVHKSLLSGRRTVVVLGETRTFYKQPGQTLEPAFMAEAGVICRLRYCRDAWCQVQTSGFRGWAPREYLWGVYADEEVE